jgi:hypothetical protein
VPGTRGTQTATDEEGLDRGTAATVLIFDPTGLVLERKKKRNNLLSLPHRPEVYLKPFTLQVDLTLHSFEQNGWTAATRRNVMACQINFAVNPWF